MISSMTTSQDAGNETSRSGPLAGFRVIELAGLGLVTHAALLLADLGADVVRVESPDQRGLMPPEVAGHGLRGRTRTVLDLKNPADRAQLLELVLHADVLVESFRPGVAERLGVGPELCARNPRLVYARLTGWGQTGPWSNRPGHDINYMGLTGALHAIGRRDQTPVTPLALAGDFGGGSTFAVMGILAALVERGRSGRGQVVDAAAVDGISMLAQMIWALRPSGLWSDERESNLIDGACPLYDTYECADGKYVSVGALEPQFCANLLRVLGLADRHRVDDPFDRSTWPALRDDLTAAFRTRSRDEWCAAFDAEEACVTPVLAFGEVADHPHHAQRGTFVELDGVVQPAPAPRFSRTVLGRPSVPPVGPRPAADVVAEWARASVAV
jgi:alpha-methylacyl-CoA racemase